MELEQQKLKVQALKESLANHVAQYEDRIAELRVQLTVTSKEKEQALQRATEAEAKVAELESSITELRRDTDVEG